MSIRSYLELVKKRKATSLAAGFDEVQQEVAPLTDNELRSATEEYHAHVAEIDLLTREANFAAKLVLVGYRYQGRWLVQVVRELCTFQRLEGELLVVQEAGSALDEIVSRIFFRSALPIVTALVLAFGAALGFSAWQNRSGQVFSGRSLTTENFSGRSLVEADFSGSTGSEVNFQDADLRGADFRRASLVEANFNGANLEGADLREADLSRASFTGAKLRGAQFQGAKLPRASLRSADLTEANLIEADLGGADLSLATLDSAVVRGASFLRALLHSVTARKVDFSSARTDGADWTLAVLTEATLSSDNICSGKSFNGAVLSTAQEDMQTSCGPAVQRGSRTEQPSVSPGDAPQTESMPTTSQPVDSSTIYE